MQIFGAILVAISAGVVSGQFNLHHWTGRSGVVNLFEWKWRDVAVECEQFLSVKGFGGVLVSPPTENALVLNPRRPWWERYQPISHYLNSRSGTEDEFMDMVSRCNIIGVRVYVDVVLNHMAGMTDYGGVGGSLGNVSLMYYPAVPYTASEFNPNCEVTSDSNPLEIRNCRLNGSPDLNLNSEWVRDRIVNLLNKFISYGVAGFRIDAAKYMWPADLQNLYSRLLNLSEFHGFPPGSRAFISQLVDDTIEYESISKYEYSPLGTVSEYLYSQKIGSFFSGQQPLTLLQNWGPFWGFLPSERSVVFIDNHINQRIPSSPRSHILTHRESKSYILANVFMLAHPYGLPQVMSSFEFNNIDQGPPSDASGNTVSPTISEEGFCGNGWICEHRWTPIANMVGFRNAVADTSISLWVDNGAYQVAFCRGNRGFVAFNLEDTDLDLTMQTCLSEGTYCDVISGSVLNGSCTGYSVQVDANGLARIYVAARGGYGALAIHVNSKVI
ncbi:alpha-amylase A-like [Uranotaenia lowii]|uniref:alpha-amylase A-like n=1 Tax=Uranotaenia lowii TaxID=190385 RepID=UPI00247A2047|nr:alpha-amylase A-like [Uranotaenia lowii]